MPAKIPYLFRRGDCFAFRIAVPADLRDVLGRRELTKGLDTSDKHEAAPRALMLAARAKALFNEARMKKRRGDTVSRTNYSFSLDLDEFGKPSRIEVNAEPHEMEAVNSAIRTALETAQQQHVPPSVQPMPGQVPIHATTAAPPVLTAVIGDFLRKWPQTRKPMLKKLEAVLQLFLEVIGDMPVTSLRQMHINDFFRLVLRLPPRWKDQCRKKGVGVRELAEQDHPANMAPNTFEDTYKASMRLFLKAAFRDWQDQGFPTTLTVEGIKYVGTRKPGENKQRAYTPDELKRLFEGEELRRFAANPEEVQCFWLPVLGLYTGARVNELCQINPQVDVFQDGDTGIWCLVLTEETEADEGIEKSIKTAVPRAVPIHRELVELGFLAYVDAIKASGAKRLFPMWVPSGGIAARNAMRWFSAFLKEIGLHGVENKNGRALRGMHAFRHTLLTYGKRAGVNLRPVSGHAEHHENDNSVAAGYEDDTLLLTLADKKRSLDQLDYGLMFPKPVLPST